MRREHLEGSIRVVLFLSLAALTAFPALAVPVPATGLTPGVSGRRNLSTINLTVTDALAGNVTQLDINAISVTSSWQGYYGNISGNVILADAANRSLYEWGNGTTATGEVFAARTSAVDWGSINCSDAGQIAGEETYLGQSSGDADSATKTFNTTSHPSFLVGMRNMTGCPATYTFVNGAAQTSDFPMVLLSDGANETIYTAVIDNDATGYDGQVHDFQLLVGENGKPGNDGPTTYYFFVELG